MAVYIKGLVTPKIICKKNDKIVSLRVDCVSIDK